MTSTPTSPTTTSPSESRIDRSSILSFLMPKTFTVWTMVIAVASVISQAGIIVTGGAVRLTQSGLGCPTWPTCTDESLVNTPEMGIHGIIEFGNRTLTFVLMIIAILMIMAFWRLRATHPTLFVISIVLFAGIPGQGVIGGITVLTQLNPWVVSLHFLLSTALVALATLQVNRVGLERRMIKDPDTTVPAIVDGQTSAFSRGLSWVIFLAGWVVLVLGTVVTGTGPHGGDADAPRHDFDELLVTRLHVFPVYLMTIATIVLIVLVHRMESSKRQKMAVWGLLAVIVLQALVGFYQHFNGLPIVAVLLHMVGTGLTAWAMTNVWDRQRARYGWTDQLPESTTWAAENTGVVLDDREETSIR